MYKNNFDQSSTGTNIEFFGCYDNNLSCIYFEEGFKRLDDSFYITEAAGNPATLADIINTSRLAGMNKKELESLAYELESDWHYIPDQATRADLIQFIKDSSIKNIDGLQNLLRADLELYITRGYCQGDQATVIKLKNESCDYIDHLFWDSPVYARFTINDQEYNYDEYDLDCYDWQRDEFLKAVSEASGVDVATLEKIAPDQLEYE